MKPDYLKSSAFVSNSLLYNSDILFRSAILLSKNTWCSDGALLPRRHKETWNNFEYSRIKRSEISIEKAEILKVILNLIMKVRPLLLNQLLDLKCTYKNQW